MTASYWLTRECKWNRMKGNPNPIHQRWRIFFSPFPLVTSHLEAMCHWQVEPEAKGGEAKLTPAIAEYATFQPHKSDSTHSPSSLCIS